MTAKPAGTHTRHEILTQPQTWSATLQQLGQLDAGSLPDPREFEQVIFCGCGSTHYLSLWAARQCETRTGVVSRAAPSSELLLFPDSWGNGKHRKLLVAVSRSGQTTETVQALKHFLEAKAGEAVVITCYPDSTIAKLGARIIVVPEGQEQSVAQTRSFTNMMLAVLWLIERGIPDELPHRLGDAGRALLETHARQAEQIGRDETIQRLFFLGSGPLYGLANEAMLKMKEVSLSYAEAFHFHEFRHGPMSMVDSQSLVIGLLHDENWEQQQAVLRDMKVLGARTLGETEDHAGDPSMDEVVAFQSGIAGEWRAPLYLPVLQLMAYERSMHKGLNPDLPANLTAVVVLNDRLQ